MNGKLPKEADAGAVDIEGGALGIAVKLPVADGLQTYHNIFQADIARASISSLFSVIKSALP